MGKDEDNTENSDDESTPQKELEPETIESEDEEETKEEKTEKVDNLRKVIKVEDNKDDEQKSDDPAPDSRESLEQKRAVLQSIKDFDFQIKKNQEELTSVNKKLDSVTKDLDDLVSLYEIVSEQMNPFVGLSKVTKKRIDALENFTKEIDDLKNRMGDIESFAVKAGVDLKTISENRKKQGDKKTKTIGEKIDDETEKEKSENDAEQKESEEIPIETNEEISVEETSNEIPTELTPDKYTDTSDPTFNTETANYAYKSYDYLDEIIEKSLKMLSIESQMDKVIDEFIENLKA